MASRPGAPRAGRRLPLLQPGRRHAAARDHPGRAHRRRRSRNGVRDRQDAEEDDDPGQGLAVLHRQPAPRPLHGRGREGRRRGHPDRGRRPRLRRAGADAAVRPARPRRPGDRAAQQRDAAPRPSPTASTSRRTCAASSRPRKPATTSWRTAGRSSTPRSRRSSRSRRTPCAHRRAGARARALGVLAEEVRLMLAEGVAAGADGHRPRHDHRRRLPVLERRPHARCSTARASPRGSSASGCCPRAWRASPPEPPLAGPPCPPTGAATPVGGCALVPISHR